MLESGPILITGASGFIGRLLASALEPTHGVIRLVRHLPEDEGSASKPNVVFQDLSQPLDWGRLPKRLDTIIHLAQATGEASADPGVLFSVNTASTIRLLEYGKSIGLKRIVLASTGSVYGLRSEAAREDDPVAPTDPYAVSKIAAEQHVALYGSHFDNIILRIFRPYGPGQRERLIPTLVNRISGGEAINLVNGGQPACQPLYIDDLVEVFMHCLGLEGCHVFNVAGPEATDIRGLSEVIGGLVGRAPVFSELSDPAGGSMLADTSRLQETLGIAPVVGVAQGLEKTVAWLMANDPTLTAAPGR